MLNAKAAFDQDGVACIKSAFAPQWLPRLKIAVEDLMYRADGFGRDLAGGSGQAIGSFYSDIQVWKRNDVVREFIEASGIAEVAARVMEARRVRLLSDQLLVKEPNTSAVTPWHQDYPYFPCSGDQICSVWLGLDPVSHETGAMSFVKGSHRAGQLYQPLDFATGAAWNDEPFDGPPPDVWGNPKTYSTICYAMSPGDVTVHHARTLHGAGGNTTVTVRRRGYTVRIVGDDVRWEKRNDRHCGFPAFSDGEPLRGPEHPLLWSIDEAVSTFRIPKRLDV